MITLRHITIAAATLAVMAAIGAAPAKTLTPNERYQKLMRPDHDVEWACVWLVGGATTAVYKQDGRLYCKSVTGFQKDIYIPEKCLGPVPGLVSATPKQQLILKIAPTFRHCVGLPN